jgi:purine nucleosidase
MGGAIRHEGNQTALAEFNTFVDPHAAHIAFHAGIPTMLVPLDVTYECILTAPDVERLLKTDSPISKFIKEATDFYMEYHDAYQGIKGCIINDPLALALTFAPELCDYQELPVDVDISGGVSMGKTFADFYNYHKKPANMRVALGVRARDFMEVFLERMERLAKSMPRMAVGSLIYMKQNRMRGVVIFKPQKGEAKWKFFLKTQSTSSLLWRSWLPCSHGHIPQGAYRRISAP